MSHSLRTIYNPHHQEKKLTVEELHALTSRAVAEGNGHLQVLVPSLEGKGYGICKQARLKRIWLDLEKGIVEAETGVNALVLTPNAN